MEINPEFSEAHLRSSIPHPKTDGQHYKLNCISMNNPMAQVYKNVISRNKIGIPMILGQGTLVIQKPFERKCAITGDHSK